MVPLRFTLFQCREENDPMRLQEIECFLEALQIQAAQLRPVNIPFDPIHAELFESTDVFLVGGSGDYSVREPHEFLDTFLDFLRQVCQRSHPMFASCFGFQALCLALGGQVIHDPDRAEVGTYLLHLTPEAQSDPLFGELPSPFSAQMGHKDRADTLPQNAVNLAYSTKVPFEAFKIKEKPIYATQFHPELTMQQNRQRFEHYVEQYSDQKVNMDIETIRNSYRESRETSSLLPAFINRIVLTTSALNS